MRAIQFPFIIIPFQHPLESRGVPDLKVSRWFNTEPITLSSLYGKIVVLNFWSTSVNQEICDVWLPALVRIHEKYSDKGVVVIGVHTSVHHFEDRPDIQEIKEAVKQRKITYPVGISMAGSDRFGATFKNYAVKNLPTILFVDKAGKIRTLFLIGGSIEAKVLALLNE